METRQLKTEIFGRTVKFDYAEHWVGYSLLAMRVTMGWIMLQGALTKLVDPSWTAAGYLSNTPAGNPFNAVWTMLAAEPYLGVVNILVVLGLLCTGIGLMAGLLTRISAFFGALMNLFFWASSLKGGLLAGLPVAHGWVVDSHIIYIVLMLGVAEFGAGRILGLDAKLEKTDFVQKRQWIKRFLAG